MDSKDFPVGILFLLSIIGVLGNSSLFHHYSFIYLSGCRLRHTDLIVINLIVANILVLISIGFNYAMSPFWWYHILDGIGCRFFFYLSAVGKGMSIGTTCLLSIFQAITISPMKSRWAELKVKAPKYIIPSVSLCWILQMLVKIIFPIFVSSNFSNTNNTNKKRFGHCASVRHDKVLDSLYAALIASPDVLCFVLMVVASGFMVFILYRHKQRVQHIHQIQVSSRSSPESRATITIFTLVSTFVFLSTLSSIFQILLATLNNPSWLFLYISSVLNLCFPTISPFLIMGRDSSVSRLSFAWIRNIKSPNLRRNM